MKKVDFEAFSRPSSTYRHTYHIFYYAYNLQKKNKRTLHISTLRFVCHWLNESYVLWRLRLREREDGRDTRTYTHTRLRKYFISFTKIPSTWHIDNVCVSITLLYSNISNRSWMKSGGAHTETKRDNNYLIGSMQLCAACRWRPVCPAAAG